MGIKVNSGVISGKVSNGGYATGRVFFYGMIGDPSNGKIPLYDENGVSVTDLSCDTNSEGYFMLPFGWDPTDIGRMLNTDLRGLITVTGISTTSDSIISQNLGRRQIKFAVAVCLGNIQFNPVEDYTPKYISILMDFYIAIRQITFHPILNNMIKPSTEMIVVMGSPV